MNSDCIYPQIEERLVPAHENQDYESEYTAERYDGHYRKWASKQEFTSLVRSLSALDLPSAQHIEDIQNISADDLKPIISLDHININNHSNKPTKDVPELLVSESLTPPDDFVSGTSWGNADDIPTRAPSAALEEFPPLVRCSDRPAMWYADDYILDIDESILSDWSFSSLLNADDYGNDDNGPDTEGESPDSSLFSCKEDIVKVAESKDDESWAFISPANSTIPFRPPCTDTLHCYERELSGYFD